MYAGRYERWCEFHAEVSEGSVDAVGRQRSLVRVMGAPDVGGDFYLAVSDTVYDESAYFFPPREIHVIGKHSRLSLHFLFPVIVSR